MELDYPKRPPLHRNPNLWLQMTLLIGFIFCLLLGVGALTALVLLRSEPASPTTAVREPLALAQITAQHALRQLAGDPADALAYQALPAGELDLATAIAVYTVDLPAPVRLTILLQTGRRYLAAGRSADAIQSYHLARTLAVTMPSLTFSERSQALIQIADGLGAAEASAEAADAAVQALRVAEQTPDLLPAQRSQVAETLLSLADELRDSALRGQVNALLRDPYYTPAGTLLPTQSAPLGEPLDPDPEVGAAVIRREQAAAILVERMRITGGIDFEPERNALAVALLEEERTRALAFQRATGTALTPGQQYTLLDQRRAWTALRLRIAYGAFGIDLLPEWSANRQAILQEYAAVTNNMITVAEALLVAGDDPVTSMQQRIAHHLWLVQQAEIGLYLDRPLLELDERLRHLQRELANLGAPLSLPVAYDDQAQPAGFRIMPFTSTP
jgi:hypothetical protein